MMKKQQQQKKQEQFLKTNFLAQNISNGFLVPGGSGFPPHDFSMANYF